MGKKPNQVVVSKRDIGQRIRSLRQQLQMTQVELSERLDMTQSNLSAIERGARGVTVHQVVRIAKALGASTDEILVGENVPTPRKSLRHRRLLQQLQRVEQLPDSDRRVLLQILAGMLKHRQERRARGKSARITPPGDKDSRVA